MSTNNDWHLGLTMDMGDDGTYPFVEDDNCNITGYGHQDKAEFAAAINRYDAVMSGETYPEDEQWDADYIGHTWVVPDENDERLHQVVEGTPGAIPVTTLWGQR